MIEKIRFPNITGTTDGEQLKQIRSYLYQLVEQLNYTLSVIDMELQRAQSKNTDNTDSKEEE